MKHALELLSHLDKTTLIFALVPSALICTLTIFFIYLTQKRFRGMGEWSLGFFFLLISYSIIPLIPFFEIIVTQKLAMLFANYFFLTGTTTLLLGTRRFFGLPYSRLRLYIHMILPVAIYFFFLFVLQNARGRFFIVSAWGCYIFFWHAYLFFHFKTKDTFVIDLFGFGYTGALSILFFIRTIRTFTLEIIPEHLFMTGQFSQIASFFGLLLILGVSVIFILVRSSRLESELNSKMEELFLEIEKRKQAEFILSHEATTDSLTGIANRRKLFEQAEHFFRISKRYSNSFSVIICDIDHFKRINDSYGHDIGDLVLKEIALILKLELRKEDILARYGGEEFVLLLPETKIRDAIVATERIRKIIEQNKFVIGKRIINITCSFGASAFKKNDKSILDIIKRSDRALYKSKEMGRNQVTRF